jgi:predicted transcriptional regulator
MPDEIRIEANIPADLDEALDRLASARGQTKSALVREALSEFVITDEAFRAAVEEGLADARAGHTIPHEQVMREIEELLARKR